MKKIPLTKGKFALVDDEDFDYLGQWKWSFSGQYAVRGAYLGRIDGKDRYRRVYMHRDINKTPRGMETDHINQDKLDNRKTNLRSVNKGQNNRNRKAYKCNVTGIVGVVWYKQTQRYCAQIVIDKKRKHLGYYVNINDAIQARKAAEQLYAI